MIDQEFGILRINLTEQNWVNEKIPLDVIKRHIGGKGLGSRLLLDEIAPNTDPLSPENKLIIACGPLSGTMFPTGNRYGLFFKSPLTNTFAESYSGGSIAKFIRATQNYVIIIEGKASTPTYLEITKNEVKFRDASYLWGKDTHEITDMLTILNERNKRDIEVLCIGRAGENLVRFSSVQNNKSHSAGRNGPGAVMGSKLLKAIVFNGREKPVLNSHPKFLALIKEMHAKLNAKQDAYGKEGFYRQFGTPIIVDWANELGCFPSRYYSNGHSKYSENVSAHTINKTILKKRSGCWNCPFTCKKTVVVEEGPMKCEVEGPEYETIANFGGLCDIRDAGAVAKLNDYCDRVGLDTISAGAICALAIESKYRKRIPELIEHEIDYNNPLSVLNFLEEIVEGKGIAKEFALGTKHVEKKYGLRDYAMHVKGLDFAGYDPRPFRGFALSYGVAPEGPTHLRSVYHGIEKTLPNREEYEGKAAAMAVEEDRMAIIDSLIVCKFIRGILDWDTLAKIYSFIFEEITSVEELRKIAANMITLNRKFNVQQGFSRKDDYLPDRVYKEEISSPSGAKHILNREKYDLMLDEYYELRGWDKDGIPL